MKALLIVVGVLFLLLAFALFIGAIVAFLVIRNRRAKAMAAAPDSTHPSANPPRQAPTTHPAPHPAAQPLAPPPPPPPRPVVPATAPDFATVVMDTRQLWGALHGTSGPVAGRVFPIDAKGFYIGRDRELSQVVIESPSVSKRHVWIGVRDGSVMAIDQNSTNGTYLNDQRAAITEVRLSPEDTLILSDDVARLTYRV